MASEVYTIKPLLDTSQTGGSSPSPKPRREIEGKLMLVSSLPEVGDVTILYKLFDGSFWYWYYNETIVINPVELSKDYNLIYNNISKEGLKTFLEKIKTEIMYLYGMGVQIDSEDFGNYELFTQHRSGIYRFPIPFSVAIKDQIYTLNSRCYLEYNVIDGELQDCEDGNLKNNASINIKIEDFEDGDILFDFYYNFMNPLHPYYTNIEDQKWLLISENTVIVSKAQLDILKFTLVTSWVNNLKTKYNFDVDYSSLLFLLDAGTHIESEGYYEALEEGEEVGKSLDFNSNEGKLSLLDGKGDVLSTVDLGLATVLNSAVYDPIAHTLTITDVRGTTLVVPDRLDGITINNHSIKESFDLTKADIGLGNVDNTSDVNKPVSTLQQVAIDASGHRINLEINNSNFKIVAKLYDKNNNLISTSSEIDLPLESVVVSGTYDNQTKKVILTLQNGSTIEFSVADLVAGLQPEINAQHKLASDLVDDSSSVHKFVTQAQKTKLDNIEAGAQVNVLEEVKVNNTALVPEANKSINIDLTPYALGSQAGANFTAEIDNTTYVMTFKLLDRDNNILAQRQIDLPMESVVVSGSYDNNTKSLILTLSNGSNITIPVGDLVDGLQTEITEQNKLDADLVDDTNSTHKFVTSEEKQQISTNTTDIADIKNGEEIDSFADVENALNSKVKIIEVSDIRSIHSAVIDTIRSGDIVVKNENGNKHTYVVSYKEDGVGICLTYTDAENVETVSYDYLNNEWVFNSVDYNHKNDYVLKTDIGAIPTSSIEALFSNSQGGNE